MWRCTGDLAMREMTKLVESRGRPTEMRSTLWMKVCIGIKFPTGNREIIGFRSRSMEDGSLPRKDLVYPGRNLWACDPPIVAEDSSPFRSSGARWLHARSETRKDNFVVRLNEIRAKKKKEKPFLFFFKSTKASEKTSPTKVMELKKKPKKKEAHGTNEALRTGCRSRSAEKSSSDGPEREGAE